MDKLDMQSKNLVDDNIEKIAKLFPNCITEGKNEDGQVVKLVDFDLLKQELSKQIVDGNDERYTLNWAGKKQAILTANSPINATLRPCREESVDFDNTKNLYIEGDNLDVLKLLRETYLGKVKMIYIDPPYNTGNDFVYEDDFATSAEEYLKASKSYDEQGNRLFQNNESNGRFHSDWLSMIYSRLKIAKDLLSDDGIIVISIDENEIKNLKCVCDEIFGEKNIVNCVAVKMSVAAGLKMSNKYKKMIKIKEYLLMYAKSDKFEFSSIEPLYIYKDTYEVERSDKYIENIYDDPFDWYFCSLHEAYNKYRDSDESKLSFVNRNAYRVFNHVVNNSTKKNWEKLSKNDKIKYTNRVRPYNVEGSDYKYAYNDHVLIPYNPKILEGDMWSGNYAIGGTKSPEGGVVFNNGKKPLKLLNRILKITTNKTDFVMDFFSGSASTAHAVMQLNSEDGGNRKFIMVQLPENCDEKSEEYKAGYKNICEIGKERIRRAGKKIKELNSMDGDIVLHRLLNKDKITEKDREEFKKTKEYEEFCKNLDTGFRVLKLDSSCMKDIYYSPMDLTQNMLLGLEDNIKEDRTAEDLLFQVMLDMGVVLSSEIKTIIINGKKVFNVNNGNLICCFEKDINEAVVTEIAKMEPLYAVFRDSSMSTDSVAVNFDQIFETYSPTTTRKVL